MRGQKRLAKSEARPALLAGLAVLIALAGGVAGSYSLPGTRIPLLNPVPAMCLAAMLVYGLRAWPAILAGSAGWAFIVLSPAYLVAASYALGMTLASVIAAWGIFRYWRLDLARNGVHNLMVVYLFGALAFAAVMMVLVVPAVTSSRHAAPTEAMLLALWLLPYMVLDIAVFLPAIMLLVLKLPPPPDGRSQAHGFLSFGVRGWIGVTVVLAALHFSLMAADRPEFAVSLRYLLLLMVVIAALRFDYRFNAIAALAVVAYLVLGESWFLERFEVEGQLAEQIGLTLVSIIALLAAQLIAMFRLEGHTASVDIRRHASHDITTGLLKRDELRAHLSDAASREAQQGREHAFLHIDVDRFSLVNDNCGIEAGDMMLREIADLIAGDLPVTATVARLGGDDFAVLLRDSGEDQASEVASTIRRRVSGLRSAKQGNDSAVTTSIGVVPFSGGRSDPDVVLLTAHTAMSLVQASGGDGFRLLRLDDDAVAARKRAAALVTEIRGALQANRFQLYCQELQPLQETGNNGLSFEVLSRITDQQGRPLPPVEVFPIAEKFELMREVDRVVVSNAVSWLASRPECVARTRACCINLSGASIDPDNLGFYLNLLDTFDLPPEKLCFEVTETAAVTHFRAAVEFISGLKAAGCSFALDDFGAGMSSFEYFRELPVDKIKIDGAFIRGLERGSKNYAIVQAVVSIARAFSLQTVAEFVENDTSLELLRELGITYAQGHVVGKAEPIEEFFRKRMST
ncbi:MAG: EAL domain-containing protein [Gammaproteobacteria bacterium]